MEPKFIHLRKEHLRGCITVAYHVVSGEKAADLGVDLTDKQALVEVGLAFCAPTEPMFMRKKGNLIATGRLNAKPFRMIVDLATKLREKVSEGAPLKAEDVADEVITRLVEAEQYDGPGWWKKTPQWVARYLKELGF